jgi:hypothetical protein
VSHGCIRLHNRDAVRLFHNVQVGTEVVIVGGGRPEEAAEAEPAPARKVVWDRRPAAPQKDEFAEYLKGLPTEDLLYELDGAMRGPGYSADTRWPAVAAALMARGVKEDDPDALRGLLLQLESVRGTRLGQEYATFLADAFARGPRQTLDALGRLDRAERMDIAAAIVDATMTLYPGEPGDQVAPLAHAAHPPRRGELHRRARLGRDPRRRARLPRAQRRGSRRIAR